MSYVNAKYFRRRFIWWFYGISDRPSGSCQCLSSGEGYDEADILDVDGNYELEIDLPGFKKEDVKIQLKNGYLNIQATREEKKDEKDDKGKYVRRERYTGTCNRSFYVGSSIKHEDIHAKYENGILHVTFPKEETKKEAEEKKFVSIDWSAFIVKPRYWIASSGWWDIA